MTGKRGFKLTDMVSDFEAVEENLLTRGIDAKPIKRYISPGFKFLMDICSVNNQLRIVPHSFIIL